MDLVSRSLYKPPSRGAWVAHPVGCLTLDFGSGRDIRVMGSSPLAGSMLSAESTRDSLSLFLPLPLPTTHAVSLSL